MRILSSAPATSQDLPLWEMPQAGNRGPRSNTWQSSTSGRFAAGALHCCSWPFNVQRGVRARICWKSCSCSCPPPAPYISIGLLHDPDPDPVLHTAHCTLQRNSSEIVSAACLAILESVQHYSIRADAFRSSPSTSTDASHTSPLAVVCIICSGTAPAMPDLSRTACAAFLSHLTPRHPTRRRPDLLLCVVGVAM